MILRNILLSAIVVGLFSGLLYGLFQHAQISPIIYAAEQYEVSEETPATHSHEDAKQGDHHHDAEAWAPEDGFERIAYTLGADIGIAIAYAILMISLMALHDLKSNKPKLDAMQGIAWGILAMIIFFVAPAMFGLHPEVPGTEAAALEGRQTWWTACVVLTAAGFATLYYAPLKFKAAGLLFLALPHLIGAPMPDELSFANTSPEAVSALTELSHQFYSLTAIGMVFFFVLLGSMSGFAVKRFVKLESL
ncbi:CbtA family protein [Litoribacillus peritrichatus]|uniref:CbtA family protein n=1 Tax=Litoribacillus peritrichatus TaxID=718191 RepID=A0ABP7MF00_9GAMM